MVEGERRALRLYNFFQYTLQFCSFVFQTLLKSQLLCPLLETLLSIMSLVEHADMPENDSSEEDDAEEEMEGSSLPSVAAQVTKPLLC